MNVFRTTLRRALAVTGAAALASIAVPLLLAAPAHAATVTIESGVAGCQGVVTTPGSENTTKRLIAGDLEPGGTVTFEINYPVDAGDVNGDFAITDCVFINDVATVKYTVSFVPNNTAFLLTFNLQIPADAPVGALYCNYAKTTQSPSASQASNRKANPACFHIGGDLRIIKLGSDTGDTPLAGASFDIVCTTNQETVPPVVISGLSGSTTFSSGAYRASGVAATGIIGIAGPEGTPCEVTETDPPAGYDLPADPVFDYVIPSAFDDQTVETIVDPVQKNSPTIVTDATSGTVGDSISDTATLAGATADATGTITFNLYGPSDTPDCTGDVVFTDDATVSGNGDYTSASFTPDLNGDYYWVASYSGDAHNEPATGTCGDDGETSTLEPSPSPTITHSTTPPSPTSPTPSHSENPVAATGAGPVDGQLGWALALLALGGAIAFGARERYRRQH